MPSESLPQRLSNLAGATQAALERYKRADAERIAAALDAGALLNDAKAAAGHGQWLPYLDHLGVRERTVQRWMRLAKAGVKSATVADFFGGLTLADDALAEFDWPAGVAACGGDERAAAAFVINVRWAQHHWRLALDRARDGDPETRSRIVQAFPDGPPSVAEWCRFGDWIASFGPRPEAMPWESPMD